MRKHRSLTALVLWPLCVATLLSLAACSGGTPEPTPNPGTGQVGAGPDETGTTEPGAGEPGDVPVLLSATLQFTAKEDKEEGTAASGMRYSRNFGAQCSFKQRAWMWTNSETNTLEFRLRESEPGVLTSEFTGGAEATGDSVVVDLEHTPTFKETSTVRLRGAMTRCLIRQLEPAQFGQGYDITLDFQAALTGTTTTATNGEGVSQTTNSPGYALSNVLETAVDGQEGGYHLINSPSNTGAHLHAAYLQLRPALGARPTGEDPELKLQGEIYDGLAAHPETAWLGLSFDPEKKIWTFIGSHATGAGAKHTVNLKIEVLPDPPT